MSSLSKNISSLKVQNSNWCLQSTRAHTHTPTHTQSCICDCRSGDIMSLFGHVVISFSLLQAGLNLRVFIEFMKTCELGLGGRLKGSKDTKAVLPSEYFVDTLMIAQLLCVSPVQLRTIVLYSWTKALISYWENVLSKKSFSLWASLFSL